MYTRSFNVKVRQSDPKAVIVGRILSYRKLGLTSGIADDHAAEASGVLLSEQERLKLETLPSFSAVGDGWEDCSSLSVCGFSFIHIYT